MLDFTFSVKDAGSERGQATVVVRASTMMQAKLMVKEHMTSMGRTDLISGLQMVGRSPVVEIGLLHSDVEKLPALREPGVDAG